jgi:hypothetical protein
MGGVWLGRYGSELRVLFTTTIDLLFTCRIVSKRR